MQVVRVTVSSVFRGADRHAVLRNANTAPVASRRNEAVPYATMNTG